MKNLNSFLCCLILIFLTGCDRCWIGCSSISRDINTDTAKIVEDMERSKFSQKNLGNVIIFPNSSRENGKAILQKDNENKTLSFWHYGEPQTGSNIKALLNFGVVNALTNELDSDILVSEDKRCKSLSRHGYKYFTTILVCKYGDDVDLPISNSTLDEKEEELKSYIPD